MNQKGTNNVSNFQWFCACFKCYRGHTTAMSGVCLQWCHEDSPVDPVGPLPQPLSLSDNDGIAISECCMVSNSLCTDAVKILCICLDKRKESKTFCMLHESIISSLKVWVHFHRFWCHVQTNTSFVFPFVYNTIVFYSLSGAQVFRSYLAVMSQFVQWGMMCCWEWILFFQVKWLK